MEMLKIFKAHPVKTSLLDDFLYYEYRQKILQEERARLLTKSFKSPIQVSPVDSANNQTLVCLPLKDEKIVKHDSGSLKKTATSSTEIVPTVTETTNTTKQGAVEAKGDMSSLKIGSLTINPKGAESKPFTGAAAVAANDVPVEIVTVGSMPVKVNGFAESSGFLTVGTIPLDSGALKLDKAGASAKKG